MKPHSRRNSAFCRNGENGREKGDGDMPIGTLNTSAFSAMNNTITAQAQRLVANMIVVEVAGGHGDSRDSSGDNTTTHQGGVNILV